MAIVSGLRPVVAKARQAYDEGRKKLRAAHEAGMPGVQLCSCMSDLMDTILLDLIRDAYNEVSDGDPQKLEGKVAVIPHGGFGRRDVSPFSDVDLMLLYRADSFSIAEPIAQRLTQDIVDVGMALGFSARTPRQACSLAMQEAEVFTSLSESRYLSGSVRLYRKFMGKLARQARRNTRMVLAIEEKRLEERGKYGETTYMLRPNVKQSAGGLRDIQLIRWLGFIRFGETDIDRIYRARGMHKSDYQNIIEAREYLLRLRNELHFHAGKAEDVLGRNEQLRIAELRGYEGDAEMHTLPVENFMRDYFKHSSQVGYAAEHFMSASRNRFQFGSLLTPLFTRNLEGMFRIGPTHIGVARRDLGELKGNLVNVLNLMRYANLYDKWIEHQTWKTVRDSMIEMDEVAIPPEAARHFVTMLKEPNLLRSLIRRLHEVRVLEKLLPGFRRIRCKMQFNQYHKYTVDEHTMIAMGIATSWANEEDTPLGKAYRAIPKPERLHLAILLHDVGKGYPGDHSVVGEEIADRVCTMLGMSPGDNKAVRYLVRHHLSMSHLAFRRDISDDSVVAKFAADVGRPDYLRMLYILTCADITACGPDVMTNWKMNLLTELYHRAMYQLSGETLSVSMIESVEPVRQQVKALAESSEHVSWYFRQIDTLPTHFLADVPPEYSYELLRALRELPSRTLSVNCRYLPEKNACEYTIGKHDEAQWDVLHKLTGAISGAGLDILTASVSYLHDPLVFYRFIASDDDFDGEPDANRVNEVKQRIEKSLLDPDGASPTFRKTWGGNQRDTKADQVLRQPTRVRFDNETVADRTIIDVFTHDRPGLLHRITEKMCQLGLRVYVSKIGTYVDQVVDAFYVTDDQGQKIQDQNWLEHIRKELLTAVDEHDS